MKNRWYKEWESNNHLSFIMASIKKTVWCIFGVPSLTFTSYFNYRECSGKNEVSNWVAATSDDDRYSHITYWILFGCSFPSVPSPSPPKEKNKQRWVGRQVWAPPTIFPPEAIISIYFSCAGPHGCLLLHISSEMSRQYFESQREKCKQVFLRS